MVWLKEFRGIVYTHKLSVANFGNDNTAEVFWTGGDCSGEVSKMRL